MAWRRSAATDAQILESYERLRSARLVAEEVGLSTPTVSGVLKKHGVQRSRSNSKSFEMRSARVTDAQIVQEYARIKSGITVAKQLGVAETTVYDALKRAGVPTRGVDAYRDRVRAFNPDMVADLVRRYEEGLSIARIAEETNVSAPTVWAYLRRAGVKTERRSRLSRTQKETIRSRYLAHVPLVRIAEEVSSTEQTVRLFLRKECRDIWVEDAERKGERAPGWRGGRSVHRGYVYLYIEPSDPMYVMADKRGYVLEHRLNLARKIGRPLRPTETVHHIDGDHSNNDPDNLQLRQGRHGKHVVMRCADCGSFNIEHAPLSETEPELFDGPRREKARSH